VARRRKRLVLYSGGQERRNALIHQDLLALSPSRRDVRMTYVPFCSEGSDVFFRRFVRRYSAFGGTHFDCLPVDQQGLRRAGLLDVLRRFARNGGVLAGLSAGALLLTPTIALAGYPEFDRDENDVGLRQLAALNLVSFEFFPHYAHSPRLWGALREYSRSSRFPVYACRDGSGIVIEDDQFTAHGEAWLFHQGHELKIVS
jgi:dipeptidase E